MSQTNKYIIWKKCKKMGHYYCLDNNCGLAHRMKLEDYLANTDYEYAYQKLLTTGENQYYKNYLYQVLLIGINSTFIIELRIINCHNIVLSLVSDKLKKPVHNLLENFLQMDNNFIKKEKWEFMKDLMCDIANTINDIMDLNSYEKGEYQINIRRESLNILVEEITRIITRNLKGKNIQFKYEIASNVPNIILTDGNKIRQVLVNLLNNAITNTISGNVTLSIKVLDTYQLGDGKVIKRLQTAVKDTGQGMNDDVRRAIEFILGISQNPPKIIPPGLGLIICRYICQLIGGRIYFETSTKGSVFYFEFDVEPA
jgi:K+-sensing histidine kinase KdpD